MGDARQQALFRALGPFEVLVDGRAANLGGARQRLVLAGLVAHANAVVPNDRRVDIVCGDEPPGSALTTVQELPRLGAALGERTATRSPGYVLRGDDGEPDLGRFEPLPVDATRLTTAPSWARRWLPRASALLTRGQAGVSGGTHTPRSWRRATWGWLTWRL
jgi:hypothetical protein